MVGKTHIIGGVAASLAVAHVGNFDPVIMIGAGVVGALLPDICHGGSLIGRKMPLISKLVNALFGHRSFTHSILFLVITAYILNSFIEIEAIRVGFLVGMVSHLLLDMATKNGVKLFYPISVTVRFPLTVKTGGSAESVILGILTLLSFYYGYIALSYYV